MCAMRNGRICVSALGNIAKSSVAEANKKLKRNQAGEWWPRFAATRRRVVFFSFRKTFGPPR